MFLYLRIIFTILSAISLAALFPVGTFFGWGWAGMCGLLAFLFFGVMLLCKQSQQAREQTIETEQSVEEETNTETTEEKTEK